MQKLEFVLYGQPATKKNSMRPIKVKRRNGTESLRLLPSAAFEDYEADCLRQITGNYRRHIDTPVNVKARYYMETRRQIDLTNLNESIHDILVKARVLMDDNRNIIASTDGSRVYWDKKNPRVEITITDAEPEYTQWDTKKGVKSRESLLDHLPRAAHKGR